MTKPWPTMKTRRITLRHYGFVEVDATVDVSSGKALVSLNCNSSASDDIDMRPHEAEALARALIKAAKVARAKDVAAKLQP